MSCRMSNGSSSSSSCSAGSSRLLRLNGVPLYFPPDKKPFPQQLAMMSKCMKAMSEKQSALVESPTGTGKTLALLTASLSWQKWAAVKESKVTPVFYSSRTHSQITQVIKELNATCHPELAGDFINATTLGSRDQLCINNNVKRTASKGDLSRACRTLTRRGGPGCEFHDNDTTIPAAIRDIESLYEDGRAMECCPFYASRANIESANLVFCPYKYLIDPRVREQMKINLADAVVILDEAHNIHDECREASSIDISFDRVEYVTTHVESFVDECMGKSEAAARELVKFLTQLRRFMHNNRNEPSGKKLFEGSQALSYFRAMLGVSPEFIDEMSAFIHENSKDSREGSFSPLDEITANNLGRLFLVLGFLFDSASTKHYRVIVHTYGRPGKEELTLSIWSMSPSIAFKHLAQSCRSLILTSGTLSPLPSFSRELGMTFEQQLSTSHVIDVNKQLWAGVLKGKIPTGEVSLKGVYAERKRPHYQQGLGTTLAECLEIIPNGTLCFFPSFSFMKDCIEAWKTFGLWKRIKRAKKFIVIEGDSCESFDTQMRKYKANAESDTGAIYFGVYRGKGSEGIDFSDKHARGVFIVGIPFAPVHDLKIVLKKAISDEWYKEDAFRALNQALGRVIRHKNDFGAVVFLDSRFGQKPNQTQLSRWTHSSIKNYSKVDTATSNMRQFFLENEERFKCHQAEKQVDEIRKRKSYTVKLDTAKSANTVKKPRKDEVVVIDSDSDVSTTSNSEPQPGLSELQNLFPDIKCLQSMLGRVFDQISNETRTMSTQQENAFRLFIANHLKS